MELEVLEAYASLKGQVATIPAIEQELKEAKEYGLKMVKYQQLLKELQELITVITEDYIHITDENKSRVKEILDGKY
jgi:predicted ATP-dependent serine protease